MRWAYVASSVNQCAVVVQILESRCKFDGEVVVGSASGEHGIGMGHLYREYCLRSLGHGAAIVHMSLPTHLGTCKLLQIDSGSTTKPAHCGSHTIWDGDSAPPSGALNSLLKRNVGS
jgi:hypothetical protein